MANKVTKRQKFEMALEYVKDNEMLTEFFKSEIANLEKKAGREGGKPTKEQLLMAELMDTVEGALTAIEKPLTVSEIVSLPEVTAFAEDKEKFPAGITTQRMTACLHKMVEKKRVKKIEGKVNRFALTD